MDASGPPLRSDAARNRQRLLDAASELFASEGLHVSLNDIAHHAGVGVGTAYRRFANKGEVIDALFEERLRAMALAATTALEDPDPWAGLVGFLEQAMHLRRRDQGLNEIMNNPALGDARVAQARDQVAPILAALVARAKEHGVVRADLEQTDLVFAQVGLAAIMESSRSVAPELYRRYLALFLDAIRGDTDARPELPVPALDAGQTHRAMTRERRT